MKYLNIFAILIIILSSCQDDTALIVETPPSGSAILENYNPPKELILGTVFGTVIDEFGEPIINARVLSNGRQYSTNDNGNFIIQNESLDQNGAFLTVEKSGFFIGSRRFYPENNSINYVTIQLMELSSAGEFDAVSGGSVTSIEGVELDFPENSIQVEGSGELYTGSVSVAARWLDPTASNINEIMPGDLIGINTDVEEVSLVSYGMVAVELFGDNGEKLNLAAENKATISFPVPNDLLADAPQEIPLWSFEEEKFGIWVEEGTAALEGDKYVGQVGHFSFWNCDVPYELVEVCGQLVSSDGTPVTNAKITVQSEDLNSIRCGYTNNRGFFSGKFPKNFTWNFSVGPSNSDANCGFQTLTFGPFTDADPGKISLGSIPLESLQIDEFRIRGSIVDCGNEPVTNGIVTVGVGSNVQSIFVSGDGNFDETVLNCNSLTTCRIYATNIDGLEIGSTIEKSISSIVDCSPLAACGTSICVAQDKFVGDYMLTIEGASGIGYGPPYSDQVVTISTVSGSNSLRQFSSEVLEEIGGFGPYDTTFEILCDRAVYQLMDTQGLGCGGGGIMFGPALDENGEFITEPLDPNDDSRVILFFNEGFSNGGCPGQTGETVTKMVLTKL